MVSITYTPRRGGIEEKGTAGKNPWGERSPLKKKKRGFKRIYLQ